MDEALILMGVIGRPHGVRGHVRVTAYTADPRALADYPLTDPTGRRLQLRWVSGDVAEISELTADGARKINDRDAAARLTNTELFAPRSALPPAEEDEFYLADLMGMSAFDVAQKPLGTVSNIHDYGAGTSLEISRDAATPVIVPFTRQAVPHIDLAARSIIVALPGEIIVENTGDAA